MPEKKHELKIGEPEEKAGEERPEAESGEAAQDQIRRDLHTKQNLMQMIANDPDFELLKERYQLIEDMTNSLLR